jgi:hypothetical protein
VSRRTAGEVPDDLGQLPAEVDGVLDAVLDTLAAGRIVDVRGVTGEEDPAFAIGSGLAGRVGEPGDPDRIVEAEIGSVDGDHGLAEFVEGGLGAGREPLLGDDDPHRAALLRRTDAADAEGSVANAVLRLFGHLHLGDQCALRGVPAGELDSGRLANHAAAAVTADQVSAAQ